MLLKIGFGVFSSLSDFFTVVAKPGATLFNESLSYCHIQNATRVGNSLTENYFKLCSFERRRNFVFDNFDARLATDDFRTVLDLVYLSDV